MDLSPPHDPAHAGARGRRIRVAVVAETAEERERLSAIVGASKRFRLVGSYTAGHALAEPAAPTPDVIVVCARNEPAFEAAQQLARENSGVPCLLVVSRIDGLENLEIDDALNAVQEIADLSERTVLAGLAAVSEDNDVAGITADQARADDELRLASLTTREREVLALTGEGCSIREIAERLNRAYGTVAAHRVTLMRKLGIHDKVGLARFAIRTGIISA